MMKSEFRCSAAARAACEFRKVCGEDATFHEGSQCYDFNKEIENRVIVKTNADHIRAMSDEELARFLKLFLKHLLVKNGFNVTFKSDYVKDMLKWLQQPVKEDK